jgi:cobalt-zinc-cadmium efflux system membrane fusion protein
MINVHAELLGKSSSGLLVPGMYVQAKIALDPQEGWSVPTTAVVVSDEQSYVLVLRKIEQSGYKLEKIKVQTGRISGDFIELMPDENLLETTKLLVKGGFNLLP